MTNKLNCFKAYDVRGELGTNFNGEICYRIGRAFAKVIGAKTVVVGRDTRETSSDLLDSLVRGLLDEGVTVFDIGLAGTEEMYWATSQFGACGGIEVTASHNPINYNGLKMVKSDSEPLDVESEFNRIKKIAEANDFGKIKLTGNRIDRSLESREAYVTRILKFVDKDFLRPLKVVVNSGNGTAGPTFDALALGLSNFTDKLTFERMHHTPDSSFPNGIPNPLLPKYHLENKTSILKSGADLGIAFDGDFDRCFFFDEKGSFVPGQYIVALLAEVFLMKQPRAVIIHDSRVIWNIQHLVKKSGGISVCSRTGHAFVKQAMREENAIYGGELSSHHYFKDFAYCDSGMIPWLLIIELMGRSLKSLSQLVEGQKAMFPSSGEINFKLENPRKSIQRVVEFYADKLVSKDEFDGVSLVFEDWRLNLRRSNTEPLVRLNVESRGDKFLIVDRVKEITELLYR